MALLWRLRTVLLLLLGGALFPPEAGSSSSHSLRYFYTSVSEPGQGLPQFIVVGYVDDQLFYQYDSNFRKVRPRVTWMEKADAHYWDTQTQIVQGAEPAFRRNMEILRNRYNQSEGFHTLQWMYGCELRKDRKKGGYFQYAYDGRDYISLDKETLTWTALDVPAQITKRKWEAVPLIAESQKAYLEVICIEWLKKYLDYSKETLLRTEPPVGKVTRQAIEDGREALICQVHGFYPREIEATWMKGEENLDHETFRRDLAPNSDGTYYTWLSIEIDPKERHLYQCHVAHDSLSKPLVLAFKEPAANMLIVMALISLVLPFALLMVTIYKRHTKTGIPREMQNPHDNTIPRVDGWGSDSSTKPLNPMDDDHSSSESSQTSVTSTKELLA